MCGSGLARDAAVDEGAAPPSRPRPLPQAGGDRYSLICQPPAPAIWSLQTHTPLVFNEADRSLDVLHLLAHLLDQHLHVDRDARQLQRGGFAAQRVRLAVQFLDQKVQALANFAAFFQQAFDLVEVGLDRKSVV